MAAPLEDKYIKTKLAQLKAGIQMVDKRSEQKAEIREYLASVDQHPVFQLPSTFDLPPGLDWFNSPPLSLSGALKGKLVVLDFFTYCCINCLHVLPDLAALEVQFGPASGLCIVGVHSAKFANEKLPENISDAISRYSIRHPVVNDSSIVLWDKLGVSCWPTIVIIGPDGQLLYYIIGEGHGAELSLFVETAMEYFSGRLNTEPVPKTGGWSQAKVGGASILNYPGKVCTDASGETVFVSDAGNNWILAAERKTGVIRKVYGSGAAGLKDGVGIESEFNSPQGLAYLNDTLFVADTNNHAIRKIDLQTHQVTTIAGTGRQGNDKEGGAVGRGQELSSPWDVAVGEGVLYIAMAGTHQIWAHFLQDKKWIKKSAYVAGASVRFSGSGEEGNRNNSYPHKTTFAQPSGVALATGSAHLYVADSESSSIRSVDLSTGAAKALVGGALDPLDLFVFGDVDSKGREARLQHPMGVAWNKQNGRLYVADSYNHKIKEVDPASKECVTLAGTGEAGPTDGSCDLAQFSEPCGLCVEPGGKSLLVADSNNHVIRVVDLESSKVFQLQLKFPQAHAASKRITRKNAPVIYLGEVGGKPLGTVGISLEVAPPTGCHWTEDAPSAWQIMAAPDLVEGRGGGAGGGGGRGVSLVGKEGQARSGSLLTDGQPISFLCKVPASEQQELKVEIVCYFCEEGGVCRMHDAVLSISIVPSKSCDSHMTTKSFKYSPPKPKN